MDEMDEQATDNHLNSTNPYIIPAAIVIAGLLVAGAVFYTNRNPGPATLSESDGAPRESVSADISKVNLEGEPFIGDPNAPVTLAYWLDFQCPFCRRFDLQTLPTLIEKYVNTGKVRIVFKDYQFLGSDSSSAALVAQAVWELVPDRYFKWQEAMFRAQDDENAGFGDIESVLSLTMQIEGIDIQAIANLVQEKRDEYLREQAEDRNEGLSMGVRGTPGFVIGKRLIMGAQPIDFFVEVIEAELNK